MKASPSRTALVVIIETRLNESVSLHDRAEVRTGSLEVAHFETAAIEESSRVGESK